MEYGNNNIQPEQPQQPQQPQGQKSDGLAIASMVLGISSVLFSCCYGLGIIPAIVGLVLGIIAKTKGQNNGFALTGIITSAIIIFLVIIGVIAFFAFGLWYLSDPYYWDYLYY